MAGVGTCAAHFRATHHGFIAFCHLFAILRTRFAQLGANCARAFMIVRSVEHESGGGSAYIGAVHHQCDMFGGSMLATEHETVGDRFVTYFVTLDAVVDAPAHVRRE
jgi:hypothetical protein